MIETCICDVNSILQDNDIDELYDELSCCIKTKIDNIKSTEKKNLDIVSWAMLYRLYNDTFIKNADIWYNEHGKPYFKNITDKYFNISHSKSMIFIAISDKEIGVDIEYKKNDYLLCMKLAKRFYSDSEYDMLKKALDVSKDCCINLFYRLWTIRESFVKCIGTGLIYEKNDIVISFDDSDRPYIKYFRDDRLYNSLCTFKEIDNNDNYRYCICNV